MKSKKKIIYEDDSERSEAWRRVARVYGQPGIRSVQKKNTSNQPPPTKDTRSSAVIPPNFWTNLIFFIDFRPCFLHIFFI